MFSPPAGDFFEAVLLQRPQATEAVEKGCFSRISEETESSEAVEKRCFSRISESHVREFFGAVSWLLRPSLPWCLRLADPVFWRLGRWKF